MISELVTGRLSDHLNPIPQSSWDNLSILSECEAFILPNEKKKRRRRKAEREKEKEEKQHINWKEDKATGREWKVVFRGNLALGVFSVSQYRLFKLKHLCSSAKSPQTSC